jgi:hypothetical protein
MLRFGPRVRAVVFVAAVWALGSAAVGFLAGLLFEIGRLGVPAPGPQAADLLRLVRAANAGSSVGLVFGGLSGLAFSGLTAWLERRRDVQTLSAGRLCAWGALAGAVGPLLWIGAWWMWGPRLGAGRHVSALPMLASVFVGACLGGLTLKVARGAAPPTRATATGRMALRASSGAPTPRSRAAIDAPRRRSYCIV